MGFSINYEISRHNYWVQIKYDKLTMVFTNYIIQYFDDILINSELIIITEQ